MRHRHFASEMLPSYIHRSEKFIDGNFPTLSRLSASRNKRNCMFLLRATVSTKLWIFSLWENVTYPLHVSRSRIRDILFFKFLFHPYLMKYPYFLSLKVSYYIIDLMVVPFYKIKSVTFE